MHLEQTLTLFPRDPDHRLVGPDLSIFLDRVAERLICLGEGARARVRAGRFNAEVGCTQDLVDTIDAARGACEGREDLEVRLWGEPRAAFARFLGTRHLEIKLQAFVKPRVLLGAHLGATSGQPLDYDATLAEAGEDLADFAEEDALPDELRACWWLRLFGQGSDGIGERFVDEHRRLRGSSFFEALQGAARTQLYEWQAWS